jgi:3-hydroxyisobutyrate dehydrogenase-like beta-hydroxyacid dehydrogenase
MNIGFVGLGAMGAGIVPRLMATGHSVTGWNRNKAKAEPLIASGMRYAPMPHGIPYNLLNKLRPPCPACGCAPA